MAVLDTTFLIALERGEAGARRVLDALQEPREPLRIPAAVWLEFLSTFEPGVRAEAVRRLERAAAFHEFTREVADEGARIQNDLIRAGRPLAWHDLQVAATAAYLREPLVSNDTAFRRVPGIELVAH